MPLLAWIIVSPIALIVGFVVCFAFVIGAYVMLSIWKSGKNPEVDYSNWLGRLLGFIQLSRHIPRLMRTCFMFLANEPNPQTPLALEPGVYEMKRADSGRRAIRVLLTRPLLRMNRQDLMEQNGFRPDDGKVDGVPKQPSDDVQ